MKLTLSIANIECISFQIKKVFTHMLCMINLSRCIFFYDKKTSKSCRCKLRECTKAYYLRIYAFKPFTN